MWLFDYLKPSYNFAKNVKFILQKCDVDITKNNIITWYQFLVINDSLASIFSGEYRCPSNLNIKILKDIKIFLSTYYIDEISLIKQMWSEEQKQYLIKKFDKMNLSILDFSYEVMYYSANINWLPNYFNKDDEQIIKKFFNF